jgi:alkylhydroperoxidase family enzyme
VPGTALYRRIGARSHLRARSSQDHFQRAALEPREFGRGQRLVGARFDARERAILALTEEMARLPNDVSDAAYDGALAVLGEAYLAATMMAVIAINAWNRVGITTQMQPASAKA